MNLKYYLRGLGIGIMVTAVIMSVAADNKKQELSDAEIKARAAQLGMVEESTGLLSDLETEKAEEPKATEAPKATEEPKATEAPKATEEPTATEKPEEVKETEAGTETIMIAVNPGESSYTVCKRLEDKGLIASAGDFDGYLCDRGLDKKLRAGSYEVPIDAEPEEIAKILTFR